MNPVENMFQKSGLVSYKPSMLLVSVLSSPAIACRICFIPAALLEHDLAFCAGAVRYPVNNVPKYLQPAEKQQTEQTWPGRV